MTKIRLIRYHAPLFLELELEDHVPEEFVYKHYRQKSNDKEIVHMWFTDDKPDDEKSSWKIKVFVRVRVLLYFMWWSNGLAS